MTSPEPDSRPPRGALRTAWKWALGILAVLGAVNTVSGTYKLVAPGPDQVILYAAADEPLARRTSRFAVETTVDGVPAGDEDLTSTSVTFWRDGGIPVTAAMTRRPVRIDLPSGSRLLAWKVLDTESSVADDFHVERQGDALLLTWTVFDPDMAIRVGLVRAGSSGEVTVTGEVGPGVRVSTRHPTPLVLLAVGFAALFLALAPGVAIALAFVLVAAGFIQLERKVLHRPIPWPVVTATFILFVVLFVRVNSYWGAATSWLASKATLSVPFQ